MRINESTASSIDWQPEEGRFYGGQECRRPSKVWMTLRRVGTKSQQEWWLPAPFECVSVGLVSEVRGDSLGR